jgi:hypothetical protein
LTLRCGSSILIFIPRGFFPRTFAAAQKWGGGSIASPYPER